MAETVASKAVPDKPEGKIMEYPKSKTLGDFLDEMASAGLIPGVKKASW